MTYSLQPARRGESVIIGYILLVVLAIGMASAVFIYLKFYLPRDQPACPEGVGISIRSVNCVGNALALELANQGRFSIDGAFIKVSEPGRAFKTTINCPDDQPGNCTLFFTKGVLIHALGPEDTWNKTYFYNLGTGVRDIEVEPLMLVNNNSRLICREAITTSTVTCT